MKKFWYFGVRMKVSSANATGRTRYSEVARWNSNVYPTPEAAAQACVQKMAKHPGMSYFIQGFDRELAINADGESTGYKEGAE